MNAKLIFSVTLITLGFIFYSFQKKPAFDLKASAARGKEIYQANCITCHQENGEGMEGVFPPLAKSDYLMAGKKRSIVQIIKGATGIMKVNGKEYNMEMAALNLNDQEVSDVLNYIRNTWGNKGAAVTPEEVKAVRK